MTLCAHSRRSCGGNRTAPSVARSRRSWVVVTGGADLHPVVARRRVGPSARSCAGARRSIGYDVFDGINMRAHQNAVGAAKRVIYSFRRVIVKLLAITRRLWDESLRNR